ncbi:MAG TPA: DedA family protein [Mycobacteriales bacterium]|nr:DedA family protein [Mycobacteriales bacterium]
MHLAVNLLSAKSLLQSFGAVGVFVVLFVQGALIVGFFLPGDSLLFTAGFVSAGKVAGIHLALGPLIPAAVLGAVLGAQAGFVIGRRAGPRLFDRPDARLFKRRYVERADEYFERFGPGKAIFIARFVPVVRTFIYPLAGTSRMSTRDFTVWNVVSGVVWGIGMLLLGYYLGNVSFLKGHIDVLAVAIAVISVIPIAVEAARSRRRAPAVD